MFYSTYHHPTPTQFFFSSFFLMSSTGPDKWVSTALGIMKILASHQPPHSSHRNPIPESISGSIINAVWTPPCRYTMTAMVKSLHRLSLWVFFPLSCTRGSLTVAFQCTPRDSFCCRWGDDNCICGCLHTDKLHFAHSLSTI